MTSLAFILTSEGVLRVHDALVCLTKFHEVVGLEASEDKLILSSINSSKTSSASFSLLKDGFFQSYRYQADMQATGRPNGTFTSKILAKSLLSIFKGRAHDFKDGENSIERCEVSVQEHADKVECRFVVKMICRHGVKKTYKLTYEPTEPIKAIFDSSTARNRWTISAYILKAFSEFFGARTENLEMCYDNGRMTFDCFTEKIMHGAEVLKQPLHTSIAIDISEFEDFKLEEKLRVGISVKDFKAVIIHAQTLKTSITALYSIPKRPMQLSYSEYGMLCEFTLMTCGDYRSSSVTPAPTVSRASVSESRPPQSSQALSLQQRNQTNGSQMAPPQQPAPRSTGHAIASQRPSRPSPPAPRASVNEESLFVPDDDEEDRVWGDRNYEEDEGELRWDSANTNLTETASYRSATTTGVKRKVDDDVSEEMRIAPTQRLSQIKGLFD